jgi:8-oxo-dGTP pyrophosphatase MutT (NUDIX family)
MLFAPGYHVSHSARVHPGQVIGHNGSTMQVVYAHESPPDRLTSSLFLAGPTPRDPRTPSWRPEALRLLESRGYQGVVFVPEPRDGGWSPDYDAQVEWEEAHLQMADTILFWVPRDMATMPALTTNDEWGAFKASGKVVFAAPPGAVKVRYQQHHAGRLHVPQASSLDAAIDACLGLIDGGAERAGGERSVPLHIWRTAAFRAWYEALRAAGNRLDGARLEWVCRGGKGMRTLFLWALRASVFITAEGRTKRNEVVLGRPDVSAVLMFRPAADPLDAKVIMVREFRSAVRNPGGMILELPSGSAADGVDPLQLAVDETREETGLSIAAARLHPAASRQLASTLLSHHAQLYCVEITDAELSFLESQQGQPQGDEQSSERTYVVVATLRELLSHPEVDWSTVGMLSTLLHGAPGQKNAPSDRSR